MTKIGLEGMEFYAFHGYYSAEQKMGNKYTIDVKVELKTDLGGSDDIDDTVNYESIYRICKEEMRKPRKLLETVVFSIAEKLKSKYDVIDKTEIKLRKCGVQLGGKVKHSVIEYVI